MKLTPRVKKFGILIVLISACFVAVSASQISLDSPATLPSDI